MAIRDAKVITSKLACHEPSSRLLKNRAEPAISVLVLVILGLSSV
jgi:hypothetical protein